MRKIVKSILCAISAMLFFLFSDIAAQIPVAQEATGALIDESIVETQLYVKPDGDNASDGLSENAAVQTIARAVELATEQISAGVPTRISILPGTYRLDSIIINGTDLGEPARSTLLIIEGTEPNGVIMSGAVADGWEPSTWTEVAGQVNTYEHDWPYAWGYAANPPTENWDQYPQNFILRREMIFRNGTLLEQRLKEENLNYNSFLVDESAGTVSMKLQVALKNDDLITVGVSEQLVNIHNKSNIVLRNILFTQTASWIINHVNDIDLWGNAVSITAPGDTGAVKPENALVENCPLYNNNATAIKISRYRNVTVRNCPVERNGWKGLGFGRCENVLVEHCTAKFNAWRQSWGHHAGHDAAGFKIIPENRIMTLRNIEVEDNYAAYGMWIDWDNTDMLLENVSVVNNRADPVHIEVSPGPITVRGMVLNNRYGFKIRGVQNVRIENSYIHAYSGVLWNLIEEDRQLNGEDLFNEQWYLRNNTFSAVGNGIFSWMSATDWNHFFTTLDSDSNTWYRNGYLAQSHNFSDASGDGCSFLDWQALGKDVHSTWVTDQPVEIHSKTAFATLIRPTGPIGTTVFMLNGRRVLQNAVFPAPGSGTVRLPHGVYIMRNNTGRKIIAGPFSPFTR
ncbi:MAG: hypothetical protein GF350_14300 [Chitinivibrionales bacterium]|nr:hypothetical protein [Chitinivibrionales bacterium]